MIDFLKSQKAFNNYLKNFDLNDEKTGLKIRHTYKVVEDSEKIANELNLSNEEIQLAKLIGLLHDIGRFEQAKRYNDFRDNNNMDHATFAIELLFKQKLIRSFIETNQYDDIIYKAILNHNKLQIQNDVNNKALLFSKIVRDADKMDNFRVKEEEPVLRLLYMANKIEDIENDIITQKIYEDFMKEKIIVSTDRVTALDYWVSYIAFIYDFNFTYGLKYIVNKDYINKNIDRIDYKNEKTKTQMEDIRKKANGYVTKRIQQ